MLDIAGQTVIGLAVIALVGLVPVRMLERGRPLRQVGWREALAIDLLALGLAVLCSSVALHFIEEIAAPWRAAPLAREVREWHVAWRLPLLLVVNDLVYYAYHRALHAWWWRAHRWHHSARDLYWLSGNRGSIPDVVLQLIPLALTSVLFLEPGEVLIAAVITLANGFVQHMNVRGRWRALEWIFVTPRVHGLHHAVDPRLQGRNFGALLTVWDRLFGTYADPDALPDADLSTGVAPADRAAAPRMLLGL